MDATLERLFGQRIEMGLGPTFDPTDDAQLLDRFQGAAQEGVVSWLFWFGRRQGWDYPDRISMWWRDHIARVALYRRITANVGQTLTMPFAVLKGEPLAKRLFDDGLSRTVTDLDLLVAPEHVRDAIDQLHSLGFRIPDGVKLRPWAYNQIELRHEEHNALVELHWRLALPHLPAPDTSAVLMSRREDDVPTLDDSYALIHLAFHLFQHNGFTKGVFDLAGLLVQISAHDLKIARSLATNVGALNVLESGIETVRRLGLDVVGTVPERANQLANSYERSTGFLAFREEQRSERKFLEALPTGRFLDHPTDRLRATIKPIFFGPHRLGTELGRRLGREWW